MKSVNWRYPRMFKGPVASVEFQDDLAYLREELIYNSVDGELRRRSTRGGHLPGSMAGTVTAEGYRKIGLRGQRYYAHVLAWIYVHGRRPIGVLDHMNHDRLDNRIGNLREVTQRLNVQNMVRPKKNNALGLLGVSRYTHANGVIRYKATIVMGGFETPEEAHQVYLSAKEMIHKGYIPPPTRVRNEIGEDSQ